MPVNLKRKKSNDERYISFSLSSCTLFISINKLKVRVHRVKAKKCRKIDKFQIKKSFALAFIFGRCEWTLRKGGCQLCTFVGVNKRLCNVSDIC